MRKLANMVYIRPCVALLFAIVSLIIFSGCGAKAVTEVQYIHIPQKCEITMPERPTWDNDTVYTLLKVL